VSGWVPLDLTPRPRHFPVAYWATLPQVVERDRDASELAQEERTNFCAGGLSVWRRYLIAVVAGISCGSERIERDSMVDADEDRYVVRLACRHETLEVVPADKVPTPVGKLLSCRECGRSQRIVESFRVEP